MAEDEREIGIRELRTNLSAIVERVKAGEEIVVTEYGKPVARLGPVDEETLAIQRLTELGILKPPRIPKGSEPLPKPIKLEGEGPMLSDIVTEGRGS